MEKPPWSPGPAQLPCAPRAAAASAALPLGHGVSRTARPGRDPRCRRARGSGLPTPAAGWEVSFSRPRPRGRKATAPPRRHEWLWSGSRPHLRTEQPTTPLVSPRAGQQVWTLPFISCTIRQPKSCLPPALAPKPGRGRRPSRFSEPGARSQAGSCKPGSRLSSRLLHPSPC